MLIVFLATSIQSTAGFGVALVSMPLLVGLVGIKVATPLVSLVAVTVEGALLYRYRQALNFTAVKQLSLAAVAGIPLGVYILREVDGAIVTTILGVIVTGYALYALFTPRLPQLRQAAWAYGFGFLGGILGGAYNTSGPPAIIFGTCRRWKPATFKGNLQAYFVLSGFFTLIAHAISGNLTAAVWQNYLWTLPAMGLGLLVGKLLDGRLNPAQFRKIVLILLVILGVRLIVG